MNATSRRRWLSWHQSIGLLLAPYLTLYAVTGLLFNHPTLRFGGEAEVRRFSVDRSDLPSEWGPEDVTRLGRDLGFFGFPEVRERDRDGTQHLRIYRPGADVRMRVREGASTVAVEARRMGLSHTLLLMHGLTGLPGAGWTVLWRVYTVVSTVGTVVLVFLSQTTWWTGPEERRRSAWLIGLGLLVTLGLGWLV